MTGGARKLCRVGAILQESRGADGYPRRFPLMRRASPRGGRIECEHD
jgi:hypothetical protein